ncbi:YaaL family protein [Clostridium sp. MSJ-8]|uniref:DUF2508 family protein n=1 Tax=Clostridium sp. MSJ-8 TaxID=2841510 RepID=UPI001C0ED5BE|nr:DUF2508 family protein [Clostridium sp. MSJ-8]MBU5488141.1 YaaL family protein [Clostridium sp. MSJ-8]
MDKISIKYVINKVNINKKQDKLLKDINDTIKELENARSLFDNVQDTNLIEVAIYSEAVARKRYEYLLALAKKEGIEVSREYILDKCMKLER